MHLAAALLRPSVLISVLAHGAAVVAAVVIVAVPEPAAPGPAPVPAWIAFAPAAAEPAVESSEAPAAPETLPEGPAFEAPEALHVLPAVEALPEDPFAGLQPPAAESLLPEVTVPAAPHPGKAVRPRRAPAPEVRPTPPAAAARSAERGAVLEPPRALTSNRAPVYPATARAHGLEGVVQLLVTIETDGAVLAAAVDTSSGHAVLDQAAEDAVRSWRFTPALADGVPSRTTVRLPVKFRLS